MNWKKFNGFSLMEMMVVLLIVAIVLAASAPMISRKMVGGAGDTACPWRPNKTYGIGYNMNGFLENHRQTVFIGTGEKTWGGITEQPKLVIGSNSSKSPHITFVGNSGTLSIANPSKMSIFVSQQGNGFAIRQQPDGTHQGHIGNIGEGSVSIGVGSAANATGGIALGMNSMSHGNNAIAIGSVKDDDADFPEIVETSETIQAESSVPAVSYNYNSYTLAGLIKNAKDRFTSILSTNGILPAAFATDQSQPVGDVQVVPMVAANITKATEPGTIAIGARATATKRNAVAIGTLSEAAKNAAVAVGPGAVANATASTAVGLKANSAATATTSYGAFSSAEAGYSSAIGYATQSTGNCSFAAGVYAKAKGDRSIAIGSGNNTTNTQARAAAMDCIAIGTAAVAGKKNSTGGDYSDCIAIGKSANATGDMTTAIGYKATASANNSTAIGHDASSSNYAECVAVGRLSRANADYSVAIGHNAIAGNGTDNTDCVAVGRGANATGDMATAVGYQAIATANDTTAYGHAATANGEMSTAIGRNSTASKTSSTALGYNSTAGGTSSTATGDASNASGNAACAYGYFSSANGERSIAIGNGSLASSNASDGIAIGYMTRAVKSNSIAIGNAAHASNTNSIAIGNGAQTTKDNYIELGNANGSHTVHIPGNLIVGGTITGREILAGDHIGFEQGPIYFTSNNNGQYLFWETSDRRLKNVGQVYKAGLAELKKLDFYHYTFKKDEKKTPRVGVMAQDLQKIFPDAVVKGEDGFLRIRLEDMFYAVINAVKELDAKVTALSEQVKSTVDLTAKLQAKIDSQQKEIAILKKKNAEFEKRLKNLENKMK